MIPTALPMARDLVRSTKDSDDDRLIKGLASLMRGWMPITEQHNAERDAAIAIKRARGEQVRDIGETQKYKEWSEKVSKAREAAGGRLGWDVDMLVADGELTAEEAREFKRLHAEYLDSEARSAKAKKPAMKLDSSPAAIAKPGGRD